MKIKSMPRFIIAMSILFVLISCFTNMFISKVFSHEEPTYENITVCKGETLWSIASNMEGNINENIYEIKKLNNLNGADLYIGQVLTVPASKM